jgi:hypothetical protein
MHTIGARRARDVYTIINEHARIGSARDLYRANRKIVKHARRQ